VCGGNVEIINIREIYKMSVAFIFCLRSKEMLPVSGELGSGYRVVLLPVEEEEEVDDDDDNLYF
jgi:hypothetical protein